MSPSRKRDLTDLNVRWALLFLLVALFAACQSLAPADTATPTLSPTVAPTLAPLTTPTAIAEYLGGNCSPRVAELPCTAGVEPGQPYRYTLYTHCGIRWAYFDGRWWEADPPLDDGSGNPPNGWGNPLDEGVIGLANENTARFTSQAELTAQFKALPADVQEFPGQPCDELSRQAEALRRQVRNVPADGDG